MRDCGPEFIISSDTKEKKVLDWVYNAWGGKYPPFDKDNAVPKQAPCDLLWLKWPLRKGSPFPIR